MVNRYGRMTKKAIYAQFNIEYVDGKINVPIFGFVKPLLKLGNDKIGMTVYSFSLLPGGGIFDIDVDGKRYACFGTCGETCRDCNGSISCYGFYKRCALPDSRRVQLINTVLIRKNLDFVYRAISAQIIADHIDKIRIHATGDFDEYNRKDSAPGNYALMWLAIARRFQSVRFWTYTKFVRRENLFDGLTNANIVKSKLDDGGYNYGTCEYIMRQYKRLIAAGKKVYICSCGTPEERHCSDCVACNVFEYVFFLKHSTPDYDAKKDPLYPAYCKFVENQVYNEKGNVVNGLAAD